MSGKRSGRVLAVRVVGAVLATAFALTVASCAETETQSPVPSQPTPAGNTR